MTRAISLIVFFNNYLSYHHNQHIII